MLRISKADIQFSNKLIWEIDRIVTLNDFSSPNFWKDLNKFFDEEGKASFYDYNIQKKVGSDYKQQFLKSED